MEFLKSIFNHTVLEAFGLTLMHSLWQGAIIALVLAFLLFVLRKSSSKLRYYTATTSLFLFFLTTIITFAVVYESRNISTLPTDQGLAEMIFLMGNQEQLVTTAQEATAWGFIAELAIYFQSHAPLLMAAWMMGVVVLSLRLIGGFTLAQRLKNYKTREVEAYWESKMTNLMERVGVSKKVKLLESRIAKVPMVIGHLKPVVLVPAGMLTNLSPQQVEAILAHELAHIKRHDYLINLMQSVLEIVFFYHPATWWIAACIREERENACDDVAIEVCGDSLTFARALSSLEQRTLGAPQLAMAFYGNKGSLINRIRRLIGKPNHQKSLPEGIVLLSLLCLTFFSFAFQNGKKKEKQETTEVVESKVATKKLNTFFTQQQVVVEDSTRKKKAKLKGKATKEKQKVKDKKKEKSKRTERLIIQKDGVLYDMNELQLDKQFPVIIPDNDNPFPTFFDTIRLPPAPTEPFWLDGNIMVIPDMDVPEPELFPSFDGIVLEGNATKGLFSNSNFVFPKDPIIVGGTGNYFFTPSDSSKVDSTAIASYRKAQAEYRQAMEELRVEMDSQRVAMRKLQMKQAEKFKEERKKYQEALLEQREEMMELRKAEMAERQAELREKRAEWKEEAEAMRLKMEERREEQEALWDEVRAELVKDGLLKSKDTKLKLSLNGDKMVVNGKKVTGALLEKYQKLFAKVYDGDESLWKSGKRSITVDED